MNEFKCDLLCVNDCCRDYCQRVVNENNDLKKQITKLTKFVELLSTNKLLNVFADLKNNINYGISLLESCVDHNSSQSTTVNANASKPLENQLPVVLPTVVIKSENSSSNDGVIIENDLMLEQTLEEEDSAERDQCVTSHTSDSDINWLMSGSNGDDTSHHQLYEHHLTLNRDYMGNNYLLISGNTKHEQYRKKIIIGERVFQCLPSEDGAYRCEWPQCGKVYPQRHLLVRHYTIHGAEKTYTCQYADCRRSFSCNKLLNKHAKRIHSNEKPFVCDWPQCDYKCNDRSSLIVHRRRHTGERPFHCDWPGCSSAFISSTRMYDHRKIHTGEKPFGCDWPGCTFRAGRNVEVRKHKRVHSDDKPFKCDWPGCVFSAKNASNINQHKRKHFIIT